MDRVEVVTDIVSDLGEGPVWHAGTLHWVDITGRRVHRYHPGREEWASLQLPEIVGAIVPRERGGWVLAQESGFALLAEDGTTEPIADPEAHEPRTRFNDGKCDPKGRLWAGTMGRSGERGIAALYMLDERRQVHVRLTGVSCSNGLCWSSDGRVMYYIDTPLRRVDAFDFEPETGALANRRTVINLAGEAGVPDGMTIDAEGQLWVALWNGGCVVRCDPRTGEITGRVPVPASRVTSCTFGGDDLRDLYITTARTGLTGAELAAQPLAGRLFRVRAGVPGIPAVPYAG